MNSLVVGVDIGGSHITAALIDLEKRQIRHETLCRQTVDSSSSLEELLSNWCDAIKKCTTGLGDEEIYIGIAMPGPFDYEAGVSYIKEQDKFKALYDVNVKQVLADRLGVNAGNIQFLNDAASFLRGELFSGVAQNHRCVYGLTLGTGFGSALYKREEANDANLWCSPFKEGIAEDYFSTRWFVQRYLQKTGKRVKSVRELAALYGEEREVEEIFGEFGEHLAVFYNEQLQQEEPEMIVFGGNISKAFDYFYPSLQRCLRKDNAGVTVKKSTLQEEASLLGAASCWTKLAVV